MSKYLLNCDVNRYPKGLIVAFKLKSTTSEDPSVEKGNEVKLETEGKPDSMELGTEDKKESSPENEEKTETKKLSADMYKDNKDVVLREDLKSVFQKFGTVKVCDNLFLYFVF